MFKDSSHSMESGFCISNTYQRGIFRSEILALQTSGSPTSELQNKFYCAALGEARIANRKLGQGHRASRLRIGLRFLDYNSEQFGAKKGHLF
jgi:hypothetical protein